MSLISVIDVGRSFLMYIIPLLVNLIVAQGFGNHRTLLK